MAVLPADLPGPLRLWHWPAASPRRAARLWRRNATLFRRGGILYVLPSFLEPVLYLISIGLGIGLYVGSRILGVEYVEFIAPGLVAAAAMNGAVYEATFEVFVKLRFGRLYDAVITTPLEPEDIALGELLWAATRSLLFGMASLLVAVALGYVASPWALIAPAAILLVGLVFGLIGLIVTGLVPSMDMFSYFFSLFITPMFLFSGIFFPVSDLPAVVRPVAWLTPLHHGVELLRSLLLTGDVGAAFGHAVWLVVLALLLIPPALNLLRRRLVA